MANDNNSSLRTSLSLIASTALHGATIALIALGPTLMIGLQGDRALENGNDTASVEISVDSAANSPATETVQPLPAQPMTAPVVAAPVTVPADLPEAKPTVKKAKPQPSVKVAKSETPKLPTKTESVEPQPVLSTDDEVAEPTNLAGNEPTTDDESADPALDKSEEETEPLPAPVVADEESQEELAAAPIATTNPTASKPKEEVLATQPAAATAAAPTPVAATTAPATAASGVAASAPASTAASSSAAPSASGEGKVAIIPAASQNYVGLKQSPGNQPPRYTDEMRIKGLQGRGQLIYYVTREGRVKDIKVAQSTGSSTLDTAALQAFSQYKFVPGQEGYTVHDFEFSLKGPSEVKNMRLRTSMSK